MFVLRLRILVHFRKQLVHVDGVGRVELVEAVLRIKTDTVARAILLRVFREVHLKINEFILATTMFLPDPEIFGLAFRIALGQLGEKTSRIGDLRSHLRAIAGK